MLEIRAATEEEAASLREKLHEEKTQRLLKEQAASSLQEKVQDLEERQAGLEMIIREKEAARAESETLAKEQKLKAQKSKEKVHSRECTSMKSPLWRRLLFSW